MKSIAKNRDAEVREAIRKIALGKMFDHQTGALLNTRRITGFVKKIHSDSGDELYGTVDVQEFMETAIPNEDGNAKIGYHEGVSILVFTVALFTSLSPSEIFAAAFTCLAVSLIIFIASSIVPLLIASSMSAIFACTVSKRCLTFIFSMPCVKLSILVLAKSVSTPPIFLASAFAFSACAFANSILAACAAIS